MEWLNFRHLYAFWMVARTGSFTRAAREMHVAQSAVSSQVAALEDYVDEQLLVRTHRSVELTPIGRELLGHANSIFAQSRAINGLIQDKGALHGHQRVRLGVVGGVSRNFVYRVLEQLDRKSPRMHVSVSTGTYEELYGLLRRFELDAIVSLDPPKKKDMGEVSYQKLSESKMCVVGAPSLIADIRSKSRRLGSVDVYKFRHPFEIDLLGKYVRPLLRCELVLRVDTDDIPLLRFFANGGKGVAVLPRVGVLEDLASGTVEALELPRCPEVIIYGITMSPPDGAHGDDSSVHLWPTEH